MGDFSLSSILGHLETSKPPSKESLADPLALPTEDLVRDSPDALGSLDLAEVSRRNCWRPVHAAAARDMEVLVCFRDAGFVQTARIV